MKQFACEKIRAKIVKYCVYQERSSQEVKQKLDEWGIVQSEQSEILQILLNEGFVDDERFAEIYVRGKLNQNHWGKMKIRAGLLQKNISVSVIQNALQNIENDTYTTIFRQEKEKWLRLHPQENENSTKLKQYLYGKGFAD